MRKRSGLTLMELLIAISFLGLVILSAVAVNVAANRFLTTQNDQVRIANQAQNALNLITKDIMLSFGDPGNAAFVITVNGNMIKLRRFDEPPEGPDVNDRWVAYKKNGYKLEYNNDFPNGNWAIITSNVVSLNFQAMDADGDGNPLNDNVISITLTCRQDPNQQESAASNPEVTLTTTVRIPSISS